ncbi:unnamed protein product [Rotaria socialis]|uniref:Uncharacterized protein n=1 Tax=Rotaria socialis TaxID=392032 RepID=A0A818YI85_9BILA|nr:unnamed protein product [Rotaria socialis]CAF3754769.1 unnamed protein product [Rotaria socialis]CAF4233723.1 unnamed protein product [Rotaria socialis]CAF4508302.1 unnamed protein product [Rotaria socialis]
MLQYAMLCNCIKSTVTTYPIHIKFAQKQTIIATGLYKLTSLKQKNIMTQSSWKSVDDALTVGQTTFSITKSISTVAIVVTVASAALTVVDVAFLIASGVSDHPTIEVINNVVKQLKKELERFKDINSTIDTFKEKAFLSTVDDFQIISLSTISNDALIALLNNNNATESIEILKNYDIVGHSKITIFQSN